MSIQLTDNQWIVLDLLMRAREKGVPLNKMELLYNRALPSGVTAKLGWALLTMPQTFVASPDWQNFSITEAGAQLYTMRFNAKPTGVADHVICLPGPEHYVN